MHEKTSYFYDIYIDISEANRYLKISIYQEQPKLSIHQTINKKKLSLTSLQISNLS